MSERLRDLLISYSRTLTPIVVAAIFKFFSDQFDVEITVEQLQPVIDAVTEANALVIAAVYYLVIRGLEDRFPWLGVLLGFRKIPHYGR